MYRYLAVQDGQLILHSKNANDQWIDPTVICTVEQLADIVNTDDIVMCSSSMDFPEENTTDPAVIALCNQIRKGDYEKTAAAGAVKKLSRQKRIRQAIIKGIQFARDHGLTRDADVAICIEVELRESGCRI